VRPAGGGPREELRQLGRSYLRRPLYPIICRPDLEVAEGNRRLRGVLLEAGPEAEVPICITSEPMSEAVKIEIEMSTATNVTPDDILAGKWVVVNMAPAEWGDLGALVAAGWKYLLQRRVLRRQAQPGDNIVVVWADEYHQFANSYDAHYLAQCRSHRGCMCVLSQSLASYYAALKGDAGRHQADSLLTNFHTKIFHALGDVKTAEWASGLLGKERQVFIGSSMAPSENLYDDFMGRSKATTATSEHYEAILQTNAFMNGMRTGGPGNGWTADAIVIRSGEPFSTGCNWLWRPFQQGR
jgi:hypothetical protein